MGGAPAKRAKCKIGVRRLVKRVVHGGTIELMMMIDMCLTRLRLSLPGRPPLGRAISRNLSQRDAEGGLEKKGNAAWFRRGV